MAAEWGQWSPYPSRPGLFHERCGRCHDEAGSFAAAHLRFDAGVLRTRRSGKALQTFLRGHPGRLDAAELEALLAALAAIVTTGGQFRQRCAICHGEATHFARGRLVVRDGRLLGRYSGRDVEAFLPGHGRLDAEGAAFFGDLLRRVAEREAQP
ncbi:MAG: hypothetical protein QNJ30_20705 [Kiloniellales bacterium]|nr:hypothetical protein [Kiloniellales bacterium]